MKDYEPIPYGATHIFDRRTVINKYYKQNKKGVWLVFDVALTSGWVRSTGTLRWPLLRLLRKSIEEKLMEAF